MAKNYF